MKMEKEFEALMTFNYIMTRCIDEDSYIIKFPLGVQKGTTFGEDMKKAYKVLEQALQRLDKYEQILGSGRLTDRNYKNTTLDLDSCKPYLRLGELEDIYEERK